MASRSRSPLFAAVFVALLVGSGILGLRALGMFEIVELAAYDWYMRLRPGDPPADSRIVLITVTERDIQNQGGWPLADGVLARVLDVIGRDNPRAIGVDIYRDVPVPPGTDTLNALLSHDRRVVVVTKFGEGASAGVRPPAVLKGTDQVGFNDILVDPGGVVRRGLLFLDDGTAVTYSFALRLALGYLEPAGVAPSADPRDAALLRLGRTTIRPLEPNDGGYVGADARGYQFLLAYRAVRRPFFSVDLTTLLAEGAPPGLLRDKIVLIGATAESVKDDFYTPFSRGLRGGQHIAGVAVHAHIASQLVRMALDGTPPMATRTEWEESLWILLWSGAGAAVGLRVRSPWRFAMTAVGGLVALGVVDFVAFLAGWWIPLVPPAVAWLVVAGGVTAWVSYQEMLQRGTLMQLFSRHVSKEVAQTIWQHRDQFIDGRRPRSQRLVITALFTDLTGFTTVAEQQPPETLMEWLNEYMDAMAREVARHGGVIRQYAGDSVVVVFGVPVARRTEAEIAADAVNAVECALSMNAALRYLNRRWRIEQRATTGMRVGIFTGPAVAGTLGSADRSEYVVVGDTMNTASRLESFDKELFPPDPDVCPCRILIGETTLNYVGDRFETEHIGDVNLKGKAQMVGVYRVIDRSRPRPNVGEEEHDGDDLGARHGSRLRSGTGSTAGLPASGSGATDSANVD